MKSHPRAMIFSLAACVVYTLAYYFELSLFRYYLGDNRIHFGVQGPEAGAPILWYGWLATAVLAGVIAAFAVPKRLAARLAPDLVWLVPAVLIFAALMYEKRWFL
jgi:hypothetical protein